MFACQVPAADFECSWIMGSLTSGRLFQAGREASARNAGTQLLVSFAGEFVDLRQHVDHVCLNREKAIGYPAGNALAESARARGLNGIIDPSVRQPVGTCIARSFP